MGKTERIASARKVAKQHGWGEVGCNCGPARTETYADSNAEEGVATRQCGRCNGYGIYFRRPGGTEAGVDDLLAT